MTAAVALRAEASGARLREHKAALRAGHACRHCGEVMAGLHRSGDVRRRHCRAPCCHQRAEVERIRTQAAAAGLVVEIAATSALTMTPSTLPSQPACHGTTRSTSRP
jgi:hypothetical protein